MIINIQFKSKWFLEEYYKKKSYTPFSVKTFLLKKNSCFALIKICDKGISLQRPRIQYNK